ncbi:hypothetical protein [Kineosporia sp. R_H_3]|uniref:hypothetical protein n=1 Tax=Kineosporia sp. R_H_3 TaxID=1961848 RepID=UPI00130454B3|nr:hypothetical protein [Kineosporia sp. R_H_3]
MTGDATDDATKRPALEPGMLRRARPDGYWARAFRRRPWATSAMVILPIGVVVGVPLLAEAWVGVHLTGGAVILGWFTFSGLRTRVRATADAADEAEGADPGRAPVDVRGDAVVRPSFGPGTVTAARARDHTVTVLVLVGGPGAVTLAVAVVRRPFDLVLLGIAAALVGAALTAVVNHPPLSEAADERVPRPRPRTGAGPGRRDAQRRPVLGRRDARRRGPQRCRAAGR